MSEHHMIGWSARVVIVPPPLVSVVSSSVARTCATPRTLLVKLYQGSVKAPVPVVWFQRSGRSEDAGCTLSATLMTPEPAGAGVAGGRGFGRVGEKGPVGSGAV